MFNLRKFNCKSGTSNKLTINSCSVNSSGHIGSNMIKVDLDIVFNERFDELYVHTVFYYKYTVFRKFPIDVWENMCTALNPKKGPFYLSSAYQIMFPHIQHDGDVKCPIMGLYKVKVANVSVDHFDVPSLIPAGQYRIETNVTEKNRNNVLLMTILFVSVSDNRIEQV